MLRLFSLFGKSAALHALDDALRGWGVHPLLLPEAVKLTVLRLQKRQADGAPVATLADSVGLLAYCHLGRESFVEANGTAAADAMEARLEAAQEAGDSHDARLVLLALHAGVVAPEIAARFDIEER